MSDNTPNKPRKRTRALAPIGDHKVGYARPPKEHRFKKGQPSPNPRGRPRRKDPARSGFTVGWNNELHQLNIDEAMRPVQVREGDRVFSIPAAQAMMRAVYAKAAKGHVGAMRVGFSAMDRSHAVLRSEVEERVQAAISYKWDAEQRLRHCKRHGLRYDWPIHPEDIEINLETGDVVILGPKTPEQQEALDAILEALQDLASELDLRCRELLAHPRSGKIRESISLMLHLAATLNAKLPPRYRLDAKAILYRHGLTT